ncbi:MAG: DUF885 family protein [Betaproteobacteria bacterium]
MRFLQSSYLRLLLLLVIPGFPLFFSAVHAADSGNASAQLKQLADEYFELRLTLFPLAATEEVGDPRFEGELAIEISPAHRNRQSAAFRKILRDLKNIPRIGLPPADRVSYDVLKFDATTRLEALDYPRHLLPIHHMEAIPVKLAGWAGGQNVQPFKTVQNYDNFLKRIEQLPAWSSQAIVNMREGMRRGIVQPKAIVERALPQLQVLAEGKAEDTPFYASVKHMPDSFSAADKTRLASAYREALTTRIMPALAKLHAFVRDEYLPAARSSAGLGQLPGGAAWYRFNVRESTTTSLTPEQIHATGLKEVARILAEMEKVKARVGFKGALTDFLSGLNTRPELLPFKTEEEAILRFEALNKKIQPQLKLLFGRTPKAPLEIRPVDKLLRDTASSTYVLPAMDGSRPGVFYAAIPDPLKYNSTTVTALFLHEGQPGHHLHMALQQELDIPRFRQYIWYDAYGEGWALYAESLGNTLGVYDDPFDYVGRLQNELFRAVRLVVDTGLHAKGWTREQTIKYMIDTQGLTHDDARRATERYMVWPGQALSYKIGELKLLALRERAQKSLGRRFDIRAFHDEVLGSGALPLSMLEARIDAWIRRSVSASSEHSATSHWID